MTKSLYSTIIYFIVLAAIVIGLGNPTVQAATPLPTADWYAVTWIQTTDTLHWITPNGEQGHMARPKLANEIENPETLRMQISPNGQHMVLIASLNNGNLGVGFYSFIIGQFVQTHEAQPNEVLPPYSELAFSFTGSHFAMVLRDIVSQEWRVIVFETATGNGVDQITRTSPLLPDTFITDLSWWPIITYFNVDEGVGQSFIGLQTVTNDPTQLSFPLFNWYHNPVPAVANTPIVPASLPFSPFAGYDILRTTKATTFTGFNEQQGAPSTNAIGNFIGTQIAANQLPISVVNSGAYTLDNPQWLKNGEWIGYRVQNNVQQTHYAITSAETDTSLPLGPNIGAIHNTPDGLIAVNTIDWELYHTTNLNMDAFAYQFGNMLFQSDNLPFSVIYTTPEGASFSLMSLPATLNIEVAGNGEIQAPVQSCGSAPAPRLIAGENARVTFINGTDLNIRTVANGDYLMQIAEGTVVNVVSGPICANNYFWWQVQFQSQDTTVGGWAAEGDSDDYFLEPYIITLADPLQFAPTPTLALILVTPQPTLGVVPQLQLVPTSTLMVLQVDCVKSPASQIQVGMTAHTTDLEGTLAMRTNLSDPIPVHQIPAQQAVEILAGPQCRESVRMWQVSTNLNGQTVIGWIAEGVGNVYYITP